MITFKKLSEKYIKFNQANNHTKAGYQRILNKHWIPVFGNKQIHTITYEEIMYAILDLDVSPKTLNNCLIPLRGVFDLAVTLRIIPDSPMNPIQNRKIQLDLPDPFTKEEMNELLNWLKTNKINDEALYYWYFLLMFWTGLRPSEAFALRWIDVSKDTLYIHRSRVRGVEKSVTKTHTARVVYLNKHSQEAIDNLKAYDTRYVIICPNTGLPFCDDKAPRMRLQEAMRATGIRPRPAYNTRHTYATIMLMSGLNVAFVASQLGHSLPMMMKRYARWVNNEKDLIEMSKLDLGD